MTRSTKTAAKAARTTGKMPEKNSEPQKRKVSERKDENLDESNLPVEERLDSNLENPDWHKNKSTPKKGPKVKSKVVAVIPAEVEISETLDFDDNVSMNDQNRERSRSSSGGRGTPDRKRRKKFANERSPSTYQKVRVQGDKGNSKSVKRSLDKSLKEVSEASKAEAKQAQCSKVKSTGRKQQSLEISPKQVVFDEMDGVELQVDTAESDYETEIESEDSDSSSSSESSSSESDESEVDSPVKKAKSDEERLREMEEDPVFLKFMDRVLAKHGIGAGNASNNGKSDRSKKRKKKQKKDKRKKRKKGREFKYNSQHVKAIHDSRVKSPSDTTIYRPALRKERFAHTSPVGLNRYEQSTPVPVDNITKFINDIRVSDKAAERNSPRDTSVARGDSPDLRLNPPETAKSYADRQIIEAEKFRATVASPSGRNTPLPNNDTHQVMRNNESESTVEEGCVPPVDYTADEKDAQFFAITSHVEDKLEVKIKHGKYVDMDDLYPKRKNGFKAPEAERFIELKDRDGHSYWAPKRDQSDRVDGIKKWNAAFRVYVTLYSKANPHRAAELMEYMDTINSAAASFTWDNVAYYDFQFRKMMDRTPERSWAKTSTQLWTYAMRDHLPKGGGEYSNGSKSGKKEHCWRFNSKNGCKKSAASCRFDHRCSGCGGRSHGFASCRKRKSNGSDNEAGRSSHGKKKAGKQENPDD